jgi:hypothetical protein
MADSKGPVAVNHKFSCDNSLHCRSFILASHEPENFFHKLQDLTRTVAVCTKSGNSVVVPTVDNYACGWVCVTSSRQNMHRNVRCIEQGEGATGETFGETGKYLALKKSCGSFVGENVQAFS